MLSLFNIFLIKAASIFICKPVQKRAPVPIEIKDDLSRSHIRRGKRSH